MAIVTWDKFYPYVQPYVPGCPEIVIESHLQENAAKFLQRSEVFRFELDKDYTAKNVPDYPIFLPSSEVVLQDIHEMILDDRVITRVSDKHWNSTKFNDLGPPSYYSVQNDTDIKFYPTPDKRYTFRGYGVLKTKLTATGVEDWIFETHGRCIGYGAIADLCSVPGKEWSNPDLTSYYRGLFSKEADAAKMRDYRHVEMRVRSRNFEGRRRRY